MFNERARFRLHHPVGPVLELACAADAPPNETLARRVATAFSHAKHVPDAGAVWEPLLREKQGNLESWLSLNDVAELAQDLSALGRSEAAQGFFGGAGQHRKCAADPAFAQLLAAWTYDKLLSLAEALGTIRLEMPETGDWGENLKLSATELWASVQAALDVDLTPPSNVGGFLGIEAAGDVIQMRVVEAVYTAYRLKQLVETRGLSGSICEIGGGAGLTAYYAVLLGIRNYTIIDLPTMNAVQGYLLGGSSIGPSIALLGESTDGRTVQILPPDAFRDLVPGSIDILYNQDSFPEIETQAALGYLEDSGKLNIPLFLSINQEAHLPTGSGHQYSVPELIAKVGGYRATSRHRHWLRQGYVEELYERVS